MGGDGAHEQQVVYEGGGVALQHASLRCKPRSSDVCLLLDHASTEIDEEEGLMWQVMLVCMRYIGVVVPCCAVRLGHVCLVFRKCAGQVIQNMLGGTGHLKKIYIKSSCVTCAYVRDGY